MPTPLEKSFAEKSGLSLSEVVRLFDKAEEITKKEKPEFIKDKSKFYAYTVGIVKNMLSLEEDGEGGGADAGGPAINSGTIGSPTQADGVTPAIYGNSAIKASRMGGMLTRYGNYIKKRLKRKRKKYTLKEMSDEQALFLNQLGSDIVEKYDFDNYELVLVTIPKNALPEDFYNGVKYTLGLQRSDTDFTDNEQQFEKFDFGKLPIKKVPEVIEKVKEWLKKYNKIVIDSFNEEKTFKYERLMDRFGIYYESNTVELPDGKEHYYIVIEDM